MRRGRIVMPDVQTEEFPKGFGWELPLDGAMFHEWVRNNRRLLTALTGEWGFVVCSGLDPYLQSSPSSLEWLRVSQNSSTHSLTWHNDPFSIVLLSQQLDGKPRTTPTLVAPVSVIKKALASEDLLTRALRNEIRDAARSTTSPVAALTRLWQNYRGKKDVDGCVQITQFQKEVTKSVAPFVYTHQWSNARCVLAIDSEGKGDCARRTVHTRHASEQEESNHLVSLTWA
jgi:hypothetical protein